MSVRTLASLAVAVLLGLLAVILIRNVLGSRSSQPSAASMTPVVVAAVPIERGASLAPAMLKVVNYPKDAVPAGAFATMDQLAGAKPRTVDRALVANEPVLNNKLAGGGGVNSLSGALTPGMRAVSVKSSDVSGVGGFVMPGDRVDILVTRKVGDEKPMSVTQVLAENSLVRGIDQTSDRDTEKPVVAKAITVEVTPDQAQAIALAQAEGEISLALRQISDAAPLARKATTISDLAVYGVRRTPARTVRSAARASGPQVRVTRGVETTGYSVSGSSL